MAVLEILTYPDERLKQESKPVEVFDDALRAYLDELEETRRPATSSVRSSWMSRGARTPRTMGAWCW